MLKLEDWRNGGLFSALQPLQILDDKLLHNTTKPYFTTEG